MKFKSKIAWWFHLVVIFCLAAFISPIVSGIVDEYMPILIIGIAVALVGVPFILSIYLNTNYTLEDTILHIRSGFLINKRIPYSDIKHVAETREFDASAALSFDRIGIGCTQGYFLISPKDKQEFLKQLRKRIKCD